MDSKFVNNDHSVVPLDLNSLYWAERISMKMLRYFYVASHSQTLTQAAERLHISKSPLSAQMRELEAILGVKLFNRDKRSIQLTSTGLTLRHECQSIFSVMESAVSKVTQHARETQGQLRLGIVSSVFWAGFGYACQQLKTQYPRIQFEFLELSPQQQKVALFNNEIDIGFVRYADTLDISPLESCNLYCEPMVVALCDRHELSGCSQLCLSELANEKFVIMSHKNSASAQLVVNHCIKEGFIPQITQEVVEPMTLMNVIESQAGISVVPQSFSRQSWRHIRFISLKQEIHANICAVYNPQKITQEKQALIQSLHQFMNAEPLAPI
ncbi:LysR family transcriptional regulator [Shewanella schlegeliana]|uniref:LysR family transcriptional regulator n=1 Tax=Shewanella schlegeliana TaxID=190308 RepID=A0ABS1T318_9GAMM|nr:LysR family transcriptional regulator [Shewanella schlegeliana]MBL4915196.1 LysR family transcriptional regulator [Shewanella schlegeliana]MCL1110936.1 LysR family transcriptional regulator [Shewanella schlegeliana]GIU29538.1 LysR family transcriptional regulator [Shewanella schlegeliana]